MNSKVFFWGGLCVSVLGSIAALVLGLAGILGDPGHFTLTFSVLAGNIMIVGIGLKIFYGE